MQDNEQQATLKQDAMPPIPQPTIATPPPKNSKNDKRMYPELLIPYNEHPKRLLAFPLFAYIIKGILLFPQAVLIMVTGFCVFLLSMITPFVILFTGKLWDPAYKLTIVFMRFYTKTYLWLFGLSDKYPGFSMDDGGLYTFRYAKPATSSRFLGFPLLGFIIRMILLIPFSLYLSIMQIGAAFAVVISWFTVLFIGRYPESLYEFIKDYFRVLNACYIYSFYLSDTYPSFRISLHHKAVKIILLVIGTLLLLLNLTSDVILQSKTPSTMPTSVNNTSVPQYGN